MMASGYIITVTEADFEYEVVAFSQQLPVVVDFWAEWCVPCKTLGPLLEKLADEAQGSFRLAKVDVDSSPNLALRYGVRSIPNVKAFRDGQVVAEFVGAQPEPRLREFVFHPIVMGAGLVAAGGRRALPAVHPPPHEPPRAVDGDALVVVDHVAGRCLGRAGAAHQAGGHVVREEEPCRGHVRRGLARLQASRAGHLPEHALEG